MRRPESWALACVTDPRESAVRASFAQQSIWCERLGSPFTARLAKMLGERLDRGTAIGRRILDWPGEPEATRDALALRLCGGLHFLVRSGTAPGLAALYPPAPLPDEDELWHALEPVLAEQGDMLDPWLDHAPQTNEVGRSAVLMSGLLVAADRFPLPMRLYELGASAGLNLLLDRYGYDLGGTRAGDPASSLQLRPEWEGEAPPPAKVEVVGRGGVDLNPGDLVRDRDRLPAYIWPDQERRLGQMQAALTIAGADPPPLDRADAADWIESRLRLEPGIASVVMHSVAFQYFPPESQARVTAHIEKVGASATESAPLAWLRFEWIPGDESHSLRLRLWPGGEDRLLAFNHPHGAWVRWQARAH